MSTAQAPPNGSLPSLTARVLLGFVGTWVIALMAANLVPVIIAGLQADLQVDIGVAGALATGMTAGSALAMFVTNRFVALADRPRLARIGAVMMVVGYGVPAVWLSVPTVMAGLMFGGLGAGMMIATGTAAASSTKNPDSTVATIMIINRVGATAFLAITPLFNNDLRTVLAIIAALGVFGFIVAAGLPNLPQRAAARSTGGPAATPIAGSAGTTEISRAQGSRVRGTITGTAVLLAVSMALWSLTEDMVYSMSTFLADRASVDPEITGMLLAGKVGGGLAGALIAPLMLRWIGRRFSLVSLIAISTVTKFLMITVESATVFSVCIIIWGIVYGALLVLITGLAAVMDITGRTGVMVFAFYIVGVGFGPLVGGQLIGLVAPVTYAFIVTLPSVVFGMILYVISSQRRKYDDGNTTAIDTVTRDKQKMYEENA